MHKMMKRSASMYGVLPLLVILAVSFLFRQLSDCSRPSPEEPPTIPRPVLLCDDEPHVQRHHRDNADGTGTTRPAGLEMEGAAAVEKAIRAADDNSGAGPSATTTTVPARDMVGRQVIGSGSTNWGGALMMTRPPVRLRSELPRRVLAGVPPVVEGAPDSAAKSSCHSSDVHVSCPPSRN